MIVCICHNVPESVIKDMLKSGMSMAEIASYTGAGLGIGCAKCLKHIKQMRDDHIEEERDDEINTT